MRTVEVDSGCSCNIVYESCCADWRRCSVNWIPVAEQRCVNVTLTLNSDGTPVTLRAVVVPEKPLGVGMLSGMTGITALGGVTVRAANDVRFGVTEPDIPVGELKAVMKREGSCRQ